MAIYSYTKVQTQYTTLQASFPEGGFELATINGVTYGFFPDGETVPTQLTEINFQLVTLTDELKTTIKQNSKYCRLLRDRFQTQLREVYSMDDELYFARIGTGAALGIYTFQTGEEAELTAYKDFCENLRTWLHSEYAKISL